MTDRIQKVLAEAGLAGRRTIEAWIAEGRILVNGRPAEIGQKISHDDHVRVDGRAIKLSRKAEAPRVLLYRKKTGEVSTRDDPDGRRTVFRKLPELESGRWIGVGRLDINTSGLLLMTTDGELARRLMHPSFEIERTYAVRVLGEMTDAIRKQLTSRVELDDGPAKFVSLKDVEPPDADEGEEGAANRWFEVTVKQGRNRVVRRLFEAVDMQVSRLIRIAYGPVALGRGIKAGSFREATQEESAALYEAVGMATAKPARKPHAGKTKAPRGGKPSRPGKTSPHKPPARGFDTRHGKAPHPARKGR